MYLSVDSLHKNESVIYNKHLLKIIIFIPYATKDPVGFISPPRWFGFATQTFIINQSQVKYLYLHNFWHY